MAVPVSEPHDENPAPVGGAARSKPLLILTLALLGIPLAWSLAAQACEISQVPDSQDYTKAAALLRQEHRDGDRIAVAPEWALRALSELGDLEPTFDPLLAERPPAAARLWVVAEPEGAETLRALGERFRVVKREQVGRLTVACFDVRAGRSFRAVDHLAEAAVTIEGKGPALACDKWSEHRWDCPGRADWQHIGAEWLDVDFAPRQVIWAHPPPAPERLLLRFPDVEIGTRLEVLAGHTVHGAQYAHAPVSVVVRALGQEIAQVEREPGYPLRSHSFDTAGLSGQRGELVIEISTPDNGANHFAFDVVLSSAVAPAPAAAP